MSNRKTTNTKSTRPVFKPGQYKNRTYGKVHNLEDVTFAIKRGDTRHGDSSAVFVARSDTKSGVELTLSEARALKAFLDRELSVLAR